jgi:hypothetical protein
MTLMVKKYGFLISFYSEHAFFVKKTKANHFQF